MKISSLGKLTLGFAATFALAAGSAFANVTPNLQDSQGAAVKDGSGACVVTSGQVLPECAGPKAPPPAQSPTGRAQQMRAFCHEFTAYSVSLLSQTWSRAACANASPISAQWAFAP